MPSHDRAQTHLEQALSRQLLTITASLIIPTPRHGIHHITNPIICRQRIVQLPQHLGRLGLPTDLEKLDADLPRLSAPCIQLLGRTDNHGLDVVAGHAVGNDNDIQRFDSRRRSSLRHLRQIRLEELIESSPRRRAAERPDAPKQILHGRGRGDVGVPAETT